MIESTPLPALNPMLMRALPESQEVMARTLFENLMPAAHMLKPLLGGLRDHLAFELEKIALEIEKSEWEDRVDPDDLQILKDQRQELQRLLEQVDIAPIVDAIEHLQSLSRRIDAFLQRGAA